MNQNTRLLLAVVGFLVAPAFASAADGWTGRCVRVLDGDTIEVSRGAETVEVRLAQIDAPEMGQAEGEAARGFLSDRALDRDVVVAAVGALPSGAIVARVTVDGEDVAVSLLEAGLAWTRDSDDESYVLATMMARGARTGLWNDPDPTAPWIWRQQHAPPTPTPRPRPSLADMARQTRLRESGDGGNVISDSDIRRESFQGSAGAASEIPDEETDLVKTFAVTCPASPIDAITGCAKREFRRLFSVVNPGDDADWFRDQSAVVYGSTGRVALPFKGVSRNGKQYACWASWPQEHEETGSLQVAVQVPKLEGRKSDKKE